jgi:hypothetical protein
MHRKQPIVRRSQDRVTTKMQLCNAAQLTRSGSSYKVSLCAAAVATRQDKASPISRERGGFIAEQEHASGWFAAASSRGRRRAQQSPTTGAAEVSMAHM